MTIDSNPSATEHKIHSTLAGLRTQIAQMKHAPEHVFVEELICSPAMNHSQRGNVTTSARSLVSACRSDSNAQTLLDSFLQEFGLSNKEGVALMCLAEALLRVPDKTTADRLIAEKIVSGDWKSHSGQSSSIFVNAATWGMILTGKLIQLDNEITEKPGSWVKSLSSNISEPVVRQAIMQAMRIMGGQYVLGRSIEEGFKKGKKYNTPDTLYSFDMLGEGARTNADAQRYLESYSTAFDRVGERNEQSDVSKANGVSVKLSALHPQYHVAHYQTVMHELLPRIKALCLKAKRYNIGLSIDAEEAARLDMSLDIFECLCRDPELSGWNGLGFVLQAYQKRAPSVTQWLIQLAKETSRKIMVRLVKGAYWDVEIKHAQEQGLSGYPVFTRKANTDACYLHCAAQLLDAKEEIYPQFATHNAYTAEAVFNIAQQTGNSRYEFQRLHGMGELLYTHFTKAHSDESIPLRVYAPIGQHEDLLPYLVRRLLENGANSSFVNRFLDDDTPVESLIEDIYTEVNSFPSYNHCNIPLPLQLFDAYQEPRKNAYGIDLDDTGEIDKVSTAIDKVKHNDLTGHSIVNGQTVIGESLAVVNPANLKLPPATSSMVSSKVVEQALNQASLAREQWGKRPAADRANVLYKMADLLEKNMYQLMGILTREAGRSIPDGVAEVREAVDFCRYYAARITVPDSDHSDLSPQGVFFCISPWNLPLAIFVGQVSAALAAGNSVIAKPADQTPIIANRAVGLFHQAGCPVDVLQLIIGDGPAIGKQLIDDPRVNGVAFTGSTETAQFINTQIAQREGETIPFIAETGGQNCMIVDSTALPEQVVDDVISSAFHTAGQRCSALRVLYLQDVVADKIINMLEGAMQSVCTGLPELLSSDVGPVIDQRARQTLLDHIDYINPIATRSISAPMDSALAEDTTFFAPRAFEIDSIKRLPREVFGPILHIIRYNMKDLDSVISDINSTGYGLTFGVHSRIGAFADYVVRKTHAGNNYINRNMVGAVVGVNPFGGTGLSGTGPKAGGPNYLYRFQRALKDKNTITEASSVAKTDAASTSTQELNNSSFLEAVKQANTAQKTLSTMTAQARSFKIISALNDSKPEYISSINEIVQKVASTIDNNSFLPGPTGEENSLTLAPRGTTLLIVSANESEANLVHLASLVVTTGNPVILIGETDQAINTSKAAVHAIEQQLPNGTISHTQSNQLTQAILKNDIRAVLTHSQHPNKTKIRSQLAQRKGSITPFIEFDSGVQDVERALAYMNYLVDERTKTDNLVARGGNTQLFNL